ncbi:50S ribosomal protein L5 [Candidatus Gracilibacteria bacterium]|nr:50S ribosomal protein L5 [Candidatus Gracilibacteria bacterium]
MKSQLLERYQKEIAPSLMKELSIKNPMELPRIEKIAVNVGAGSYLLRIGKKSPEEVEEAVAKITGQKPVVRSAKKAVSNFKLREGMPVGVSVTLRNEQAYNFLDKVINIVFPRVRGFQGVKRNIFDKNGNCAVGFAEHTVFPEINVDDSRRVHGVQFTIVFSSRNKKHNMKLLENFGFPFKKEKK